jgi:hypothetical protein
MSTYPIPNNTATSPKAVQRYMSSLLPISNANVLTFTLSSEASAKQVTAKLLVRLPVVSGPEPRSEKSTLPPVTKPMYPEMAINGGSAMSENSPVPLLQAESLDSGAIQGPSLVRKESLLARQKMQRDRDSVYSLSDSEMEEGPRKRPRREPQVEKHEYFRIGCHINEPRLPIFASVSSGNMLLVQAIKEQTPVDVIKSWHLLVGLGSRVPLEKTILDNDLLPPSLGRLENVDRKKLSALIKE